MCPCQSWSTVTEQSGRSLWSTGKLQLVCRPAQRVEVLLGAGGWEHIRPLRVVEDKPRLWGMEQASRGSQSTSVCMPGAHRVLAGRAVER